MASNAKQPRQTESPMLTTLRAEHRHIANIMKLFSGQLQSLELGEPADPVVIYEIMEYMVTWPDRYHHPREDLIYSRAAELNGELAGSLKALQLEHDSMARKGREVLAQVEAWQSGKLDDAALIDSGRAYVQCSYDHMSDEEEVVFPLIEASLTAQDWRELAADNQLRPVSDPLFGPRVQRRYRNVARKLRRNIHRRVEQGAMTEWLAVEALMESLEVLSMAQDSAYAVTSNHLRAAWDDSRDIIRQTPLSAPLRCAANNTRQTFHWMGEVLEITRDTIDDLGRVSRERRERIKLLKERG
jgi:hemerythrin-like domain-containing protein